MYKIGDNVRLINYRPYPSFVGNVGIVTRVTKYGTFKYPKYLIDVEEFRRIISIKFINKFARNSFR